MSGNSFDARHPFAVDETGYDTFRLDRVHTRPRRPYSLTVVLEKLLRNEDGAAVTAEQVSALARWEPSAEAGPRAPVHPARVLLQNSAGGRASSIWSPCVTRWRRWATTRNRSTRRCRWRWSSTIRSGPHSRRTLTSRIQPRRLRMHHVHRNSGPLIPRVSAAVTDHDLYFCSVLSGNRNFEAASLPSVG